MTEYQDLIKTEGRPHSEQVASLVVEYCITVTQKEWDGGTSNNIWYKARQHYGLQPATSLHLKPQGGGINLSTSNNSTTNHS